MTLHRLPATDDRVTIPNWTADPRAVRILASFDKHPPATKPIPFHDRWTSATDEYAGYRVEALQHIYAEHVARVHRPERADGDWSAWDAFMDQPDVQAAIFEAMNPVEPVPSLFDMMMVQTVRALRPMRVAA